MVCNLPHISMVRAAVLCGKSDEEPEITINIKRKLEPVDLMVAAGIVANVLGALLMFMSTRGSFHASVVDDAAALEANSVAQTALGETLRNISALERESSQQTTKAIKKLHHATMTAQGLHRSTAQRISTLAQHVDNVQSDNTARAEFVKGRSIMNFTSREVKNDAMPPEQRDEYNRRMIEISDKTGQKIEQGFRGTEQSYLGQLVVAETKSQIEAAQRTQEQIGAAIVTVTLVQDKYKEALDAEQDRLHLLVYTLARATS